MRRTSAGRHGGLQRSERETRTVVVVTSICTGVKVLRRLLERPAWRWRSGCRRTRDSVAPTPRMAPARETSVENSAVREDEALPLDAPSAPRRDLRIGFLPRPR